MIPVVYEERTIVAITVKVDEAIARERDALIAQRKCLGCKQKVDEEDPYKGCQCKTCYPATRTRIKQRKVTKTELIRSGEFFPKTPGRKPKNAYTKKLAEL